MIELSFEVAPDEGGTIDGRELARHMIESAVALLVPYANKCPACTDALFSAIANAALRKAHAEGLEGVLLTQGEPGTPERTRAEARHLAAAKESTRALIEAEGPQAPCSH